MYSSRDKAGHYFSDVRRSIDALYFAYFITRYYPGPSSLRIPPPSFRGPWASLYELTELGGREKKTGGTRIKEKRAGQAKIPEKSERIMGKEKEPCEKMKGEKYRDILLLAVQRFDKICRMSSFIYTFIFTLCFAFRFLDSNFSDLSANYT